MLKIVPLTLSQANALVSSLHRHHKPAQGHRFSIGAMLNDQLVGACIVGRPVARSYNQYLTAEVTRLVTDGTKNTCSFLYSAAARIAKEMGFHKIQTYILDDEPGTSLRAAGWSYEHTTNGDTWTGRANRPHRRSDQPTAPKQLWSKSFVTSP